jgi:TusA-related sulfurtransferase
MSENDPSATLDVRGLFCPIPIVKLTQEVKKHPTGTIIEVLATDPGTLADIQRTLTLKRLKKSQAK